MKALYQGGLFLGPKKRNWQFVKEVTVEKLIDISQISDSGKH